jgi:hypothetical protein
MTTVDIVIRFCLAALQYLPVYRRKSPNLSDLGYMHKWGKRRNAGKRCDFKRRP